MMTENNSVHPPEDKQPEARNSEPQAVSNMEAGAEPQDLPRPGVPSVARSTVKRQLGRKRVHLGDAMRKAGLDEHKVAETYVGVVDKLRNKNPGSGGVEKVLAGVLKECSRVLEPLQPSSLSGVGNSPTPIHLIHTVARPQRSAKNPQGPSRSSDRNEEVVDDTSKDVHATASTDTNSREESR
jgi:hypothetical protein